LKIKWFLLLTLIGLLIVLFPLLTSQAQDFPDVCQQAENILPNCNFDGGKANWQIFIETGAANFEVLQGGGECHAPLCPAGYIVTDHHFIGGIYQQVPVVKGNSYYANIVWLVFDSLVNDASINSATGGIGRRLGIDPFGGTDSRSSNVVWSEDNWRNDCKICNVEHVTVTAQADTITVFLRIDDTWKVRAAEKGYNIPASKDQFWVDDIGLRLVGEGANAVEAATPTAEATATQGPIPTEAVEPSPTSPPAPTATPVAPTDTPSPATETPEPAGETATLTAELSTPAAEANTPAPEVAEIAQLEDAAVASVESDRPTPAPPPTLTPTTRPSPTATLRPVRRQVSAPALTNERPTTPRAETSGVPLVLGAVGTTACLGGMALLVAAIILAGLVWLYRLGWGDSHRDEAEEEIIVVETAP
jgi:hypothetical protein